MRHLIETQAYILTDFKKQTYYDRLPYQSIRLGNRINGITGSRGTGKTTYLLKTVMNKGAEEGRALYVSADNIFFLENTLFGLAEWIYKETDIHYLCIDEIHKYKNWSQELKNIYDTFAKLEVLFSGSSMIDLVHSKYDLSRRVSLYPMHGYSFREYLEYYHDIKIQPISLEEMVKNHAQIAQSIGVRNILKYFREYLREGYYPFMQMLKFESDRFQSLENVVQKTIYEDIATLHSLKTASLLVIEKLYKYLLSSSPGELNINKLANRVQKDFHDVSKYLSYLEQAGLVNFLYNEKGGKAMLGSPAKMLPDNTNMIYAHYLPQTQDSLIGKVRETFAVNQLRNSGAQVYFSKTGDLCTQEYFFEIGGKNKTTRQIKLEKNAYVLADDILFGAKNTIPLYLVGLLY